MTEYELQNLPRSPTGRRMFSRVSPVYDNSWFMRNFYEGLGAEWDKLRAYFETLREQHFIETVDWGIEFLEHKFSIVPDRSLTLEERRARLKRRSWSKYPLNPGILEKYARDNYSLVTYLDEDDAGYIHITLNHSTEKLDDFVKYLLVEKPAHLVLDGRFYWYDYVGVGGEDLDPNIVWTPDNFIIPQNDEEKKKVPRLFVGQARAEIGIEIFSLPKPKNELARVRAGTALAEFGRRGGIPLAYPSLFFGNKMKLQVGQTLIRGGEIIFDYFEGDMPKYENIIESAIADLLIADIGIARHGEIPIPVKTLDEKLLLRLFAGSGHYLMGKKIVEDAKPPAQAINFYAGAANAKRGEMTVKPEMKREFAQVIRLHAGQAVYRAGKVRLDSETKTSLPDDKRFFGRTFKTRAKVGTGLSAIGEKEIGFGTQVRKGSHKVKIRVGHASIRSGKITISPCREDLIDLYDVPEGDWLRLYFGFPTGSNKHVLLANPREDLLTADVKKVGDLAANTDIFCNAHAENTTGIHRASLIKGFNVADNDELALLPQSARLRLFFDFPSGKKQNLLLENTRSRLNTGAIRRLGETAAQNKLFVNSRGEYTQGITRAALIKNFRINGARANVPITFEEARQ